jgi:hypothetical protein
VAARNVTTHRHHLSAGRHLYPGLVLAHTLHAFEDYVAEFHTSFPLYSLDPEFFVLLHLGLLALLMSLIPSVAHGRPWAVHVAKAWAVVEIVNGTAHMMIGLLEWTYYPGLWTAPLLLIFGAALGSSLRS